MAELKQRTSIAETNKWRLTNEPAPKSNKEECKETTIALTSCTNTQLIKRQKTEGANNEMNGEMRKNCLKKGWGGWDIIEPSWTQFFALSSLSLVINDFRFDVSSPQAYNKTHSLLFKQRRNEKKKKFSLCERKARDVCSAAPIKQKGGRQSKGLAAEPPLWKALINPDLSGALTRGGEARQERGLKSVGVCVCVCVCVLRLIKSSH